MSHWIEEICEINGISLSYTRTGGDKLPVILLHGLMTNGLCWTGLARALEKEFDIIMPDARGHGKSSVPDCGYRYDDHADDVIGLIDALRLPAPILLGHSMGGMTAAVVAGRKMNHLRGLVLADPTFLSLGIQRQVRDSDVADQHRRILSLPMDEVMAEARSRHPDRAEDTLELFAQARLQTSMAAFDVLTPPNPDYRALVSTIDTPCLMVFGDSGVVSSAVVDELKLLNPKLQMKIIREAGHSVHLDQPDRFTEAVLTFMRTISG